MDEPFRRIVWPVFPDYHWQDWLDPRGRPVVVRERGLTGFNSPTSVEYTWQEFEKKKFVAGPLVGPVLDSGTPHTYAPMSREHASLFRTFADLDYTDVAAILDFVKRYGLLGLPRREQNILVAQKSGQDRHHYAGGESHLDWAREICLMREALQLTRTKTAAEEALDRAAWNRVGLEPPHAERRKKLFWLFNFHLQHVQARMVFEREDRLQLSYAPLTLLSAMWLQLALSVAGDKEFRACKFCRRLFEISTEQTGFRRHREFCSDTCKTKDYRKRKRLVLKLAAEGKSPAAIAGETETDKATVRAWTAGAQSGKGKK